jgi:LmbE family N-acetylglucosaminyl deacetylase
MGRARSHQLRFEDVMNWPPRVAIMSPHPDDEVIGAGSQLPTFQDVWIVQVTDGAPANLRDARAYRFSSSEEYARARRKELIDALGLAGIDAGRALELGFRDQETVFNLVPLARALVRALEELRPEMVLAPAYEGGHPDHDSVAFAVAQAIRLIQRATGHRLPVTEFALYHNRGGALCSGEFLSGESVAVNLSAAERAFKQKLVDCFTTQKQTLSWISIERECFRPAPEYDFTRPPHEGRLYYELHDWGTTGAVWREQAAKAIAELSAC